MIANGEVAIVLVVVVVVRIVEILLSRVTKFRVVSNTLL